MQTKILVCNALYTWEEVYDWHFMIEFMKLIKGLVKALFYVTLSKFGHQFLCAKKQLLISKTPCITPSL